MNTITENRRICVWGSGSWATAIVKILLENNTQVGWFVKNTEVVNYIKEHKHNPDFLSSVEFDTQKLKLYDDINQSITESDIIVVVIPSAFLSIWLNGLTESLHNKFIVSAVKGIVPEMNITVLEYFKKQYNVSFSRMGVISGPCHAEEIALERLSYLTIACKELTATEQVSENFTCEYVHTIPSTDIYGTEYSAILKNIYAVFTGVVHGLGYGDNFIAVIVANAQREITHFLNATYPAKHRDTNHSSYLGDLLVTCYSQFSRNRTFGNMIGRGYRVKDAQAEMKMVAEGYYASKCFNEILKQQAVRMPIAETLYAILYENANVKNAVKKVLKELI